MFLEIQILALGSRFVISRSANVFFYNWKWPWFFSNKRRKHQWKIRAMA